MAIDKFNSVAGFSVAIPPITVIDGNGSVTANALTASDTVNFAASQSISLGDLENIHINGGVNGQSIITDGGGSLRWGNVSNPADANTAVQYNLNGSFGGNAAAFSYTDSNTTLALSAPQWAAVSSVINTAFTGATVGQPSQGTITGQQIVSIDNTPVSNSANAQIVYASVDNTGVWNTADSSANVRLNAVVEGNGNFLAVGEAGEITRSNTLSGAWDSSVDIGVTTALYSAAYGNGAWVVVGGDNVIRFSSDTATWQPAVATPGYAVNFYSVAWGTDRFVVGGSAGTLGFSTDGGDNWTYLQIPELINHNFTGVDNSGDYTVAITSNGVVVVAAADFSTYVWRQISDNSLINLTVAGTGDQQVFVALDSEGFSYTALVSQPSRWVRNNTGITGVASGITSDPNTGTQYAVSSTGEFTQRESGLARAVLELTQTHELTVTDTAQLPAPEYITIPGGASVTAELAVSAVDANGVVTAVSIVNGGSGYDFAPQATITSANIAPARLTTEVLNGSVIAVNILSGGQGYAADATIEVSPATKYLYTDGAGHLAWREAAGQSGGGGDALPGGANRSIQFNDNSSLGGSNNFTFDRLTDTVTIAGNLVYVGGNTGEFLQNAGNGAAQWANGTIQTVVANVYNTVLDPVANTLVVTSTSVPIGSTNTTFATDLYTYTNTAYTVDGNRSAGINFVTIQGNAAAEFPTNTIVKVGQPGEVHTVSVSIYTAGNNITRLTFTDSLFANVTDGANIEIQGNGVIQDTDQIAFGLGEQRLNISNVGQYDLNTGLSTVTWAPATVKAYPLNSILYRVANTVPENTYQIVTGNGIIHTQNQGISTISVDQTKIENGNSNVSISQLDGGISISANSNSNVITVIANAVNSNTTINGDLNVGGNLTVTGNTNYINLTQLSISDPILDIGTGANASPLRFDDGFDRGQAYHYYNPNLIQTSVNSYFAANTNLVTLAATTDWANISLAQNFYAESANGESLFPANTLVANIDQANNQITVSRPSVLEGFANNFAAIGQDLLNFAGYLIGSNEFIIGTNVSITNNHVTIDSANLGILRTGGVRTPEVSNAAAVINLSSNANTGLSNVQVTVAGTRSNVVVSGNVLEGNGSVSVDADQIRLQTYTPTDSYDTITLSNNQATLDSNASLVFVGNALGATVGLRSSTSANFTDDYTLSLPVNAGNASQFLQTDGNGILSWATAVQSAAGNNRSVQFNSNGNFAGNSGTFAFDQDTVTLKLRSNFFNTSAQLDPDFGAVTALAQGIDSDFYVAIRMPSTGDAIISTSSDGVAAVWNTNASTGIPTVLRGVTIANGRIIAVGDRQLLSAVYAYSDDLGNTWTSADIATSTFGNLLNVTATTLNSANILVAVGEAATIITSIDNGDNWSVETEGLYSDSLRAVASNDTTLYAVGDSGLVFTSTGLAAWNVETIPGLSSNLVDIAYVNGQMLAVSQDGNLAIKDIANNSWTVTQISSDAELTQIAVDSAGTVVITGTNGLAYRATPTQFPTFTELNYTSDEADLISLVTNGTIFVAASNTNNILVLESAGTGTVDSDAATIGDLSVTYSAELGSVANVHIQGGAVTPAVLGAISLNGNGAISSIAVVSGGSGYDYPPRITITGANTERAVANVILNGNSVSAINIIRGGVGYTTVGADPVTATLAEPVKFLRTDGAGVLNWQEADTTGEDIIVAGANRQLQFNDGGILGASEVVEFDKTTNTFSITANANSIANSSFVAGSLQINVAPNVSNSTVYLGDAAQLYITGGKYGQALVSNTGNSLRWGDLSVNYISNLNTGFSNISNAFTVNGNYAANTNVVRVESLDTVANILQLFPVDTRITFDQSTFYSISSIEVIDTNYSANITLTGNLRANLDTGSIMRKPVYTPVTSVYNLNNIRANINNGTGVLTLAVQPAGVNGSIQFNSNGVLGGTNVFVYDNTNAKITANNLELLDTLDLTGNFILQANANSLANGTIQAGPLTVNVAANASNSLVTLGNTRFSSTALFPNVSNLNIAGGSNNQVLTTDGAANLSWANARLYGGNLWSWNATGLELAAAYDGANNPGGNFLIAGDQLSYTLSGTTVSNVDVANNQFTVSGDYSTQLNDRSVRFNGDSSSDPVINTSTAVYDSPNNITLCTVYSTLGGDINNVPLSATVYYVSGGPNVLPSASNISFADESTDVGYYNSYNPYYNITANTTELRFAPNGNGFNQPTGTYASGSNVYQAIYTGYTYYDHINAGIGISLVYDQANDALTINGLSGSELNNGNSNVIIYPNANVTFSANGVPNILQITSNGVHATSVFDDDVVITGNLNVTGNTNYFNINRLTINNPLIDIATGANGSPLLANDAYDRGQLYHLYNPNLIVTTVAANFTVGSNVISVANATNVMLGKEFFANNVAGTSLFPANAVVTAVDVANSQITVSIGATTDGNVGDTVAVDRDRFNFAGFDQSTNTFTFASNVDVTNNIISYPEGYGHLAAESLNANNVSSNTALTFGAGLNGNYIANVVTIANTGITLRGNNQQLGSAANIKITGGNIGDFLSTDGTGNLSFRPSGVQWAGLSLSQWTVLGNSAANTNTMLVTSANLSSNAAVGFVPGTRFSIASSTGNTIYTVTAVTSEPVPLQYRGTVDFVPALDNSLTPGQFIFTGVDSPFTVLKVGPNISGNYISSNQTLTLDVETFANGSSNIRIARNGNISFSANSNSNVVLIRGNGIYLNNGSNNFLGTVGNLKITGGNSGQFLQTDGTGNLVWANTAAEDVFIPAMQWVISSNGYAQVLANNYLSLYNSNDQLVVFRNGVLMDQTDYLLDAQTLTIYRDLVIGDNIDVLRQATTVATGPVFTQNYSAIPPIHFDVTTAGNNQSFTNPLIDYYASNTDISLFINGAYINPEYFTKSVATITINLPLNIDDSIDIATKVANAGNAGTSVAGANTQIQFNNDGSFGANSQFTYNLDTTTLTVPVANIATLNSNIAYAEQFRIRDANANSINLQAPSNVTQTSIILTLPDRYGADGQALLTDANGILSWGYTQSDAIANGNSRISANVGNGNITVSIAGVDNVAQFNNTGLTANVINSNAVLSTTLTLLNANDSNVGIELRTPDVLGNSYTLRFPDTAGVSNQVLRTDGSGNLSWLTISPNSLVNGNSSVVVDANANIRISSNGVANVVQISSNSMNIIGNTTAPNFIGNLVKGNSGFKIAGINSNSSIVADSYVWDFNEFGEITFPDNTLSGGLNPLTVYADGNLGFGTNGVNNMIRIHAVASANSDITFFTEGTPLMFWNTGGAPYIGTGASGTRPRMVLSESEFQITNNDLDRGIVIDAAATITIETPDDSTSANANVGAFRVFGGASIEKNVHVGGTVAAANLILRNSAGNTVTLLPNTNISANFSLTLPNVVGTNTQVLQSDGAGNLIWANFQPNSLINGNSSIFVDANANIRISSNGVANIVVISSNGVNATTTMQSDLNVTGNVTFNNTAAFLSTGIELLQSTTVDGNLTVDNDLFVNGNLSVAGNTIYANIETLVIEDPIIQLGTGENNTPLTNATTTDRGMLLHSYGAGASKLNSSDVSSGSNIIPIANTVGLTTGMLVGIPSNPNLIPVGTVVDTINANSNIVLSNAVTGNIVSGTQFNIGTDILRFVGWDTSRDIFVAASNVTNSNEVITVNTLGEFLASSFETGNDGNIRIQANLFFSQLRASNLITANTQFVLPAGNGIDGQILSTDGNGVTEWINFDTSTVLNGNSNIVVDANSNIRFSSNGIANIIVVTASDAGNVETTGINVAGYLTATGNITAANFVGILANGNSNVRILENSNVLVSVNGLANVLTVLNDNSSAQGISVLGNAEITGGYTGYSLNILPETPITLGVSGASSQIIAGNGAAGNANTIAGSGGNVIITAGNGGDQSIDPANYAGAAGQIIITAGNTTNTETPGGAITLTTGTSNGAGNGSVTVDTGVAQWEFLGTSGNLTATGSNIGLSITGVATANAIVSNGNVTVTGAVLANGNIVANATIVANGNITSNANIAAVNFIGLLANGNSNISIEANSNISLSVAGNANLVTVTSSSDGNLETTGVNVAGYVTSLATITANTLRVVDANGNSTSFVAHPNTTGNYTYVMPFDDGTPNTVLLTDGEGNLSWSLPISVAVANGTTRITPTINGNIAFQVANVANVARLVSDGNANVEENGLIIEGFVAANSLQLSGNNETTTVRANAAQVGSFNLILPATAGSNGYVLTTDGAGNTSWQVGGSGAALNVLSGGSSNSDAYATTANAGDNIITMFDSGSDPLSSDLSAGDQIIFQNDTSNAYRIIAITGPVGNAANVQITPNLAVAISSTVYANKSNIGAVTRMFAGENIVFDYSDPSLTISANTSNLGLIENLMLQSNSTGTVSNAEPGQTLVYTGSYWHFSSVLRYQIGVRLATTTALPNSPNYDNGTSGVGATLTATTNGALSIDSVATANNDRVIVQNQSNAAHNGVYVVTDQGNASATYVLTRTSDYDTSVEILGKDVFFVAEGSTNGGATLIQLNSVATVGTDPLEFQGGGVNTLQAVTQSGNSTTFGITISNAVSSNSTLTGALVVGNVGNSQLTTAMGGGNINTGGSATLGTVSGTAAQGASRLTVYSTQTAANSLVGAAVFTANSSNIRVSTSIGNGDINTGGNVRIGDGAAAAQLSIESLSTGANLQLTASSGNTAANVVFTVPGTMSSYLAVTRSGWSGTTSGSADEIIRVGSSGAGNAVSGVVIGINSGYNVPSGIRINKAGINTWFFGSTNQTADGNFVLTGPNGTYIDYTSTGSAVTFAGNISTTGNVTANIITGATVNSTGSISAGTTILATGNLTAANGIFARGLTTQTAATDEYIKIGANTSGNAANPVVLGINSSNSTFSGIRLSKAGTERWFLGADNSQATGNLVVNGPGGTYMRMVNSDNTTANAYVVTVQNRSINMRRTAVNVANATNYQITWDITDNYDIPNLTHASGVFTNTGAPRKFRFDFQNSSLATGASATVIEGDMWFQYNAANAASSTARYGQQATQNTNRVNWMMSTSWTFLMNTNDTVTCWTWTNNSTGGNVTIGTGGFGQGANYSCRLTVTEVL